MKHHVIITRIHHSYRFPMIQMRFYREPNIGMLLDTRVPRTHTKRVIVTA